MSLRTLMVIYDNGSFDHVFPMGIGALSAILKKEGHEITLWNQDMHHWPDSKLKDFLDENEKFDVVIFSLIAGYYQYQKMKNLSKAINESKNRPNYYIMGGYGPSPEPEYFLRTSGCDIVCMGEGETVISKLFDAIENKKPLKDVPGIGWLENDKLQTTPRPPLVHDLDSLPWTPYEIFPMHYYRLMRGPKTSATDFAIPLMSARGCSFKCTFCYRMDQGYRMRSPESLLDEIEYLYKDFDINYIAFQDDLLMSSVAHTEMVCKEFLKRNLPIKWECNGRLNYCSEELLQLMKDAGCVFINYGIESMDQKVLNNMKKGLRPQMIYQGIEDTLKVGISPGLNFIFGNKGDNKETLKKTVDFLLKYDDFSQKRTLRPVTPYPGSPLYYDAIKLGLLDKENPAKDFYEKKHLNSDLLCSNFTELTDDEFYDALCEANKTLMNNYFDKQKESTIQQIDFLYKNKDVNFRGFRHNAGQGLTGEKFTKKEKDKNGKKIRNWESSPHQDSDRFSQNIDENAIAKDLNAYDRYIERRNKRTLEKKMKKQALEIKKPEQDTSSYTNWH